MSDESTEPSDQLDRLLGELHVGDADGDASGGVEPE